MAERYWETSHLEIARWLRSVGYIPAHDHPGSNLTIGWDTRTGYDFTELEFYPWVNRAGVACVSAIVGHHASGTNPGFAQKGRCDA